MKCELEAGKDRMDAAEKVVQYLFIKSASKLVFCKCSKIHLAHMYGGISAAQDFF